MGHFAKYDRIGSQKLSQPLRGKRLHLFPRIQPFPLQDPVDPGNLDMVELQLGELTEEGPPHHSSNRVRLARVLPVEEIEQLFTPLYPPLPDLAAEGEDSDRFGGILEEGFGNEDLPLGVQFIDLVHDVLGPDRRAAAKESHEGQEGQDLEIFSSRDNANHLIIRVSHPLRGVICLKALDTASM